MRIDIKKIPLILGCVLFVFCASSLPHAKKRQTIMKFLEIVNKKDYSKVDSFFPLGLTHKSGENYPEILNKINESLQKYGMPSKESIVFTRSVGADPESSFTVAIVPLYKSNIKTESLESVEVEFLFMDALDDTKMVSYDIHINRRLLEPIKP